MQIRAKNRIYIAFLVLYVLLRKEVKRAEVCSVLSTAILGTGARTNEKKKTYKTK
jgi:hypothetical protein